MKVFNRQQILVIKLENYSYHINETINKVFSFLDVGKYIFSHLFIYHENLLYNPKSFFKVIYSFLSTGIVPLVITDIGKNGNFYAVHVN